MTAEGALSEVLVDLPDAEDLDESEAVQHTVPRPRRVAGGFVAEIFCGAAAITLSLILHNVPCICPWDVRYGSHFNVLEHGAVFERLITADMIVCMHFAMPCTSMTWARWPQIRSFEEPQGVSHASEKQKQMLHLGNELLAFTLKCSSQLLALGGYFSIENPELSWLWIQEGTLDLMANNGVAFVRLLFKDFAVAFYKPTLFLRNCPTLHLLSEAQEAWTGPTVSLRGLMWWKAKLQFRTHVAQTYPPKWLNAMQC